MKYEFVYRDKLSEEELSDLLNMKYRNRLGVLVHFTDQVTISPQEKGDWVDCMAAEDVRFPSKKFEAFKIPLGFSMKIPRGYEAHLAPRGSTFGRYGIIQTNGVGIVDNSYSGTNDFWYLPVVSLGDAVGISRGTRIAQFRFMPTMEKEMFTAPSPGKYYDEPTIVFIISNTLDDVDRGGFGSTGI